VCIRFHGKKRKEEERDSEEEDGTIAQLDRAFGF
jgi:hypothetical protein